MNKLLLRYLDWQFDSTGMRCLIAVAFILYVLIGGFTL